MSKISKGRDIKKEGSNKKGGIRPLCPLWYVSINDPDSNQASLTHGVYAMDYFLVHVYSFNLYKWPKSSH